MPSAHCSRICFGKNYSAEKHPGWKGGFYIHKGYIRYCHGKRKLLHRELVEKLIGRKLLKGEDVHHIDGDKLNNDINNLRVLPHKEHMGLHKR